MEYTTTQGILKLCCTDSRNLGPVQRFDQQTVFRRCQVCGCRHFEQDVELGRFDIRKG